MSWTGTVFCWYKPFQHDICSFPQRCLLAWLAMSVGITALHVLIYLGLFNMCLCFLAEHKLLAMSLLMCTQTQSQHELEVKIRGKMRFSSTDRHSNGVIFLNAYPRYTSTFSFYASTHFGSNHKWLIKLWLIIGHMHGAIQMSRHYWN